MARVRGGAPNKSGEAASWRRRCCKKVRVPVANVWRSWREGDPPCQKKAFQPPYRQHSSCDVGKQTHACTLFATITYIFVTAQQPVSQRLHSSGLTLSCLAQIATRDCLRNANVLQNSRGHLFRGSRWRGLGDKETLVGPVPTLSTPCNLFVRRIRSVVGLHLRVGLKSTVVFMSFPACRTARVTRVNLLAS